MKHYSITDDSGTTTIHFDGIFQPGDMSLCNHDLMGDSFLGWQSAIETEDKVNCSDCIRIVQAVKNIKSTEYKNK